MASDRNFWDDSSRYGFGSALRKRLFGFKIGEDKWRWKTLLAADETTQKRLLTRALAARQGAAACWVFEAMLMNAGGDLLACCRHLPSCLPRGDDPATSSLEQLLPAIESPERLLGKALDLRLVFLFGSAYLLRANAAQGSSRETLEQSRDIALRFLDEARQRAAAAPPPAASQPYRYAPPENPYTPEAMTASYEQAMYLAFIAPVVSASSSSSSDGG